MSSIASEEASNDTTIISELLNSAETMQNSTSATNTLKIPLPQTTPTVSDVDHCSMIDGGLLNSQSSDMENLNKIHIRHVHIPYILNGELYQIQTQDGENVTVKCCHCPPDRVYRGSVRSTGNFHMHIKRRHPDLLEKLHDMKVNALLERRDRLMRNRKISHRNRAASAMANSNALYTVKNEEKLQLSTTSQQSIISSGSQITLDTITEPSLMHTHKLKIKTVFQRHQMQQRQAMEMQNWKNTEYIVMPIGKMSTDKESEQPINYSLKSQEDHVNIFSSNFQHDNQQQQEQQLNSFDGTTPSFDNMNNLGKQSTNLSSASKDMENNKIACENYSKTRNSSRCSTSISCSSAISNISSHQYNIETNRLYNSFTLQHHNLSIIKPEHLILGGETKPIDLTMHTDSGIFSNSENDSVNNESTISNNNNDNRSGAQDSNIVNVDTENSSETGFRKEKWQDLLTHVENSLRDIQREMNIRNQIESNRMFLDIAKFKFLNPGFQFNW